MASVDPNFPLVLLAEDPLDEEHHKPSVSNDATQNDPWKEAYPASPIASDEQPVEPDQFDPRR